MRPQGVEATSPAHDQPSSKKEFVDFAVHPVWFSEDMPLTGKLAEAVNLELRRLSLKEVYEKARAKDMNVCYKAWILLKDWLEAPPSHP